MMREAVTLPRKLLDFIDTVELIFANGPMSISFEIGQTRNSLCSWFATIVNAVPRDAFTNAFSLPHGPTNRVKRLSLGQGGHVAIARIKTLQATRFS